MGGRRDAHGNAVLLIGRRQLGAGETAAAAVAAVLETLAAGEVPEGVHAIAYASNASAFIAEIVAGTATEVLGDGPRGSGKTLAVPGALAGLAELRARAGEALALSARCGCMTPSSTPASRRGARSRRRCGPACGRCATIGGSRR